MLEKSLGVKIGDYCSEKIWGKLGMENDAKWILDHEDGDEKTFTGIYMPQREILRSWGSCI